MRNAMTLESRYSVSCVMLVSLRTWFVSGCPSIAEYHPNEHLVAERGVAEARQQLRTRFFRAVEPQMMRVIIDHETLYYRAQTGFGTPVRRVPSENVLDAARDPYPITVWGNILGEPLIVGPQELRVCFRCSHRAEDRGSPLMLWR